jgi:hypothetical protein
MTRRLSGWQRIGVVISVCWLIGSFVGLRLYQYNRGEDSARAFLSLCVTPTKTFDQCWNEILPYRQSAMAPYWPPILFFSMVPIPIFWLVGWGTIKTVRWIKAGFI